MEKILLKLTKLVVHCSIMFSFQISNAQIPHIDSTQTSAVGLPTSNPLMFKGNAQLTGQSPEKPVYGIDKVLFGFATNGPIRSSPIIKDHIAYFGSNDGNLYAVDTRTGKEKWHFNTDGAVSSSPAMSDRIIYFSSRDGYLYAVDTKGRQQWKFAFGKDENPQNYWDYFLSSPIIVNETLYIGSGDGHVYALNRKTKKLLWKFNAGSRIRNTPAIMNNTLVFGTMNGFVYAITCDTGRQIWKFATDGSNFKFADYSNDRTSIFCSPALAGNTVIVGGRDGFLYALNLQTGKQKWKIDHEGSWVLSTAIDKGTAYVGSGSAFIVQAVDLESGKEKWQFKTKAGVFSSITITGDILYVGDLKGNIYALDAVTGKQRWNFPLDYRSFSTPVVADGNLYCSSDEGVFYALKGNTNAAPIPPEPKKFVYWEGRKNDTAFAWYANKFDQTIRDYFVDAGYKLVDQKGLEDALRQSISAPVPSVFVFSDNKIPATISDPRNPNALLVKYLNSGGKVVFFADNPFAYNMNEVTGKIDSINWDIPRRVIGVTYRARNEVKGFYQEIPTDGGRAIGLNHFWVGFAHIEPQPGIMVLAADEYGMAGGWIKNFGGGKGTGWLQLALPSINIGSFNFNMFRKAIEYGVTW